jgi:hypothetical protein
MSVFWLIRVKPELPLLADTVEKLGNLDAIAVFQ